LLLKDYSLFLRENICDSKTAEFYTNRFTMMKNEWEKNNQSDVEYPNFKTSTSLEIKGDYGYVM